MPELRSLKLSVSNDAIAEEQRIRVQGSKNMTLLPDFFMVTIYNLSNEDATEIAFGKTLSVYGEGGGLLCSGEIDDVYTKQLDANILTIVSVVDGKSFWETRIAKSFGGGTTIKKTYQGLVQNAKIGAFTADDARMIRGQSYNGRLAECVSMLAKSVSGRGYITNGTVYITSKGRTAEAIALNDDDIVSDQDSSTGVKMIKTVVKGYPVGSLVEYSGKTYRIASQKIDADNNEGAWNSYLILVDESSLSEGGMEGG